MFSRPEWTQRAKTGRGSTPLQHESLQTLEVFYSLFPKFFYHDLADRTSSSARMWSPDWWTRLVLDMEILCVRKKARS
jgi:hypothetical protein